MVEVCAQHLHEVPQPLSSRGIVVPAALEAVVLACLEKEPDRRPQSAAEVRRRLEACAVEPWDSVRARAWWVQHQPELDHVVMKSAGQGRTIAVDGASRSAEEPLEYGVPVR